MGFPGGKVNGFLQVNNGSMINIDDLDVGAYRANSVGSATGEVYVVGGDIVCDGADFAIGVLSSDNASTATGTVSGGA